MEQPVDLHIRILCLLLNEKISTNSLFKKTSSSNKPKFIKTLNELAKNKLITKEKNSKPTHKQKRFICLTKYGEQLAQIYSDLTKYFDLYKKLDLLNKTYFMFSYDDEQVKVNILKSRGFNSDEIKSYEKSRIGLMIMKHFCEETIYNILVTRFIVFTIDRKDLNDLTKSIMNFILNKVTDFKINNLVEQIEYYKKNGKQIQDYNIKASNEIHSELSENILFNLESSIESFYPKVLLEDIDSFLLSYITVLSPSHHLINKKLKSEKNYNDVYSIRRVYERYIQKLSQF